MLNFFKKVFKVQDWKGRDEEGFREQVEKLRKFYEDPESNDALIRDCKILFARLDGRRVRSNESSVGDLVELNDDLEDFEKMPNISKSFDQICAIYLKIADKLEGDDLIKVGRRLEEHTGRLPYFRDPGHKMIERRRNENWKQSTFYLKDYMVPSKVFKLFDAQKKENRPQIVMGLNLNDILTSDNYVVRFHNLLWIEEAYLRIEMRRFDLSAVRLKQTPRRGYFSMSIQGLKEDRPSIVPGDSVILSCEKRPKSYEGQIIQVQLNQIIFILSEQVYIGSYEKLLFDVYFKTSRTANKRLHHGVSLFDTKPLIKNIIFPKRTWFKQALYDSLKAESIIIRGKNPINFPSYCPNLNTQQKQAVCSLLKGSCRPMPYIIFGPPGTGKTMTLVEAILQTYYRRQNCKILVCVNSNSGVDIIAKRVLKIGKIEPGHLIRFSAKSRSPNEELVCITEYSETLTKSRIEKSRIVFATLIQAGALYGLGQEFDYLYIDEAGHATEPETLIPVGLLKMEGLLVLAGDPHQLGPVVFSSIAKDYGLGESLLQRLTERPIYQRRPDPKTQLPRYNDVYITKLIVNNRSDRRLLKVNNKMFYDDELTYTVKTPPKLLEYFEVKSPIIFEPIKGREKRETRSPSCCNPIEALACVRYVYRLYKGGMKPDKIGIITPYKLQVEKLRHAFAACKLPSCKIASIEEFQGDERLVIIISTVRTTLKTSVKGMKLHLNFLFQKMRFNVATSRSKYMSVLIGDPDILKLDTCWRKYIDGANASIVTT